MASNGKLYLAAEHDTLPPSDCPSPYLCDGLQRVITDLGVLRSQVDRIEANQDLILNEVRALSQFLAAHLWKL